MISKEDSEFLYSRIAEISGKEVQERQKLLLFKKCLSELFKMLTENEPQLFTNLFSRIIYIFSKQKLPAGLSANIKKLRIYAKKLQNDSSVSCNTDDVSLAANILSDTVEFFSGEPVPPELEEISTAIKKFSGLEDLSKRYLEKIDKIRVTVHSRGKPRKYKDETVVPLLCESDDLPEIVIYFRGVWIDVPKMIWRGAILNLFQIKKISPEKNIYVTTFDSLVALEPDYLIDVTEIAECFQHEGFNFYIYFLNRFLPKQTKYPMVAGNVINECFDSILNNPEIDPASIYLQALSARPLQIFALSERAPDQVRMLRQTLTRHYNSLKEILYKFTPDVISIEPSFISPEYGLQGRLDALFEYKDSGNFEILELKSGNPPGRDYVSKTANGQFIKTGIWNNHFAQTICYNLLMDTTFPERNGSSMILYSRDTDFPVRNAPNAVPKKQEVLLCRNWIIAMDKALTQKKFTLFGEFIPEKFGKRPPFVDRELEEFAHHYQNANALEKAYFHEFNAFILRELRASKTGDGIDNGRSGFSALWKDSIDEKREGNYILDSLELMPEESDFENFYLKFSLVNNSASSTAFRRGDMCILYPLDEKGKPLLLQQQLLKCTIKEINSDYLQLSIRNKHYKQDYFGNYQNWVLEADHIDANTKRQFGSLYEFFSSRKERRELILGLSAPEFEEKQNISAPELSDTQLELLKQAVSAKDYYLLQGPPGTGKTSYMLRWIVNHIYNTTNDNILLVAYTNRAVDEICTALKKISENFPFLRLGTKESSEHQDNLISSLTDKIGIRDTYSKVKATRVFAATVSSLLAHPEIFEIKDFRTAVIDEASQILEPQIAGILTKVGRFIMIGDEKQLPAVVTQSENRNYVKEKNLRSIELTDLRNSLFERLLRICIKNEWHFSYGMLDRQARMHMDIQEFPNKYFYDGKLKIFDETGWQSVSESIFDAGSEDKFEKMLSGSRMIFINTSREFRTKIHQQEAEVAAAFASTVRKKFGADFSEESCGVITPFRAQCSEIGRRLDPDLRKFVMVDTVERFQGSERDVIIISFAVNHSHQLKSLRSVARFGGKLIDKKLNVALTRAKKHLVILGNAEILSKSVIHRQLIDFIKKKGGYFVLADIGRI